MLSQNKDDDQVLTALRDGNQAVRGLVERVKTDAVDRVIEGLIQAAEDTVTTLGRETREQDEEDVKITERRNTTQISYGDDRISIGTHHFHKLRRLFHLHSHSVSSASSLSFPQAIYALLRRYETFFGINAFEGSGFHAAAPESVFQLLRRRLSVSQECFASPLNCYFRQFCSAFPDTDVCFGSRGSFFDCRIISGSFETGPPYTEEVMQATADRLNVLLQRSETEQTTATTTTTTTTSSSSSSSSSSADPQPLSFVVFVPDWVDPPSPALHTFERSPYLITDFVAAGSKHIYITGDQHRGRRQQQGRRYYTVPHGTHVYILQNAAGRERWPVDEDLIQSLQAKLSDQP